MHVTLPGMIAESRDTPRAPATPRPRPACPARDSALSQSLKAGTGETGEKNEENGEFRERTSLLFCIFFSSPFSFYLLFDERKRELPVTFLLSSPRFAYINRDDQ